MVDLEQMLDLATPWCLRVAATLRIPEHIAAGHAGIADLAAATGCDADALHAVLGHLVSQGVFTEESPGWFACNQAAEQLASVPFLDLAGIGGRMAHTWGTLLGYVRTGQPAYQQVFGRPFWEDLAGTVARAGELIESLGVAGRVTVEGQSFFDPLPAGADLYLLKSVLNDWPDEPTVAILRRCAEAARPSQAAIAILGGV